MSVTKLLLIIVLIAGAAFAVWKLGLIGKAHDAYGASFSAHFTKGQAFFNASKYNEAIAEFTMALQQDAKDPDAPDALMRMGGCYHELKQPEKAIETYQKLLSDYPNYKQRDQVQNLIDKIKLGQ